MLVICTRSMYESWALGVRLQKMRARLMARGMFISTSSQRLSRIWLARTMMRLLGYHFFWARTKSTNS